MSGNKSKSKPTQLYASISIAIVLFLLGLFFIIFLHTQDLGNILREKINIAVELEDNANKEILIAKLKSENVIVTSSVRYIPKEEGLKFMMGDTDLKLLDDNPLANLILFNVKSTSYSEDVLARLKSDYEAMSGVSLVYYENMVLESIKTNINRLASLILVLGLVFVFLASIIIRNTINLSMYADRDEILTLQRIGAKWGFIKMPYIKTSVMVGVKGFVIAILMLVVIFVGVWVNFPAIYESLNIFFIIICFTILFVISVAIPALVSNSAANGYLK